MENANRGGQNPHKAIKLKKNKTQINETFYFRTKLIQHKLICILIHMFIKPNMFLFAGFV